VESPEREGYADEANAEQEEVKTRPEHPLRNNSSSNDGRDGATDTVAAVSCTQDGTRWLDVCAEDIIEGKTRRCPIAYQKEAGLSLALSFTSEPDTYAMMTRGNGGVQTRIIYAATKNSSEYIKVFALPSLDRTQVTSGAAAMNPTAFPTKTSDMMVWELW
jgi:hypothetical protein